MIAILVVFGWLQAAYHPGVPCWRSASTTCWPQRHGLQPVSHPPAARTAQRRRPAIVVATIALGVHRDGGDAVVPGRGTAAVGDLPWGGDINTAQARLRSGSPVLFYPATALALTVLAFMLMGDALRDALDPGARGG